MEWELSGIALIFLFGLRHGMAADHIAIIDGLGIHLHYRGKSRIVPWLGTLFAAGHGLIITVYMAFANLGLEMLHLGRFKWLNWIPITLLFVIGFLNLRNLRRLPFKQHRHPFNPFTKTKKRSLPTLLLGVCVIMIFDTLADAAAWGYSAAASGSFYAAFAAGGIFTLGMLVTDTIDSRLLARTMEFAIADDKVARQRRILNWVIVIFSFVIGLQKLFAEINPKFELPEGVELLIGLLLMLAVVISYVKIYRLIKMR